MDKKPGFFERSARWEYDQPVTATVLLFGGMALLWWSTDSVPLAIAMLALIPIRLLGLREGGWIRNRYQRKYGWED